MLKVRAEDKSPSMTRPKVKTVAPFIVAGIKKEDLPIET